MPNFSTDEMQTAIEGLLGDLSVDGDGQGRVEDNDGLELDLTAQRLGPQGEDNPTEQLDTPPKKRDGKGEVLMDADAAEVDEVDGEGKVQTLAGAADLLGNQMAPREKNGAGCGRGYAHGEEDNKKGTEMDKVVDVAAMQKMAVPKQLERLEGPCRGASGAGLAEDRGGGHPAREAHIEEAQIERDGKVEVELELEDADKDLAGREPVDTEEARAHGRSRRQAKKEEQRTLAGSWLRAARSRSNASKA